jgi:hypothetical protein
MIWRSCKNRRRIFISPGVEKELLGRIGDLQTRVLGQARLGIAVVMLDEAGRLRA